MSDANHGERGEGCRRRDFLHTMGAAAGALAASGSGALAAPAGASTRRKEPATVRCAFLYPPSEKLRAPGGWWSWPGKDFDAEGRQRQYTAKLREIERTLGVRVAVDETPLDAAADVKRFVAEVKQSRPDGLVLVPFKHSHFAQMNAILKEARIPTVIFSCLGVKHGSVKGYQRAGVYFVQTLDDFAPVAYGLRMIHTAKVMAQSRTLSVAGTARKESVVPHLSTQVRAVPIKEFVKVVEATETTAEAKQLARGWMRGAKRVVEPAQPEVHTAARVHLAVQRLMAAEGADAIMMDCLRRGLYMPCMSFMMLRDAGVAAGCENDLGATLTLMLVQHLFGRPGFQANPGYDTAKNHYFHSHCTCPTRLFGPEGRAAPYLLRDYAHTNDPTCVPQVLWPEGEAVTLVRYVPGARPQMLLYSGTTVRSYAMPPVGGCRTNVAITINELRDACDVKGHHDVLFCGDHARELRAFAQLYGITVVS